MSKTEIQESRIPSAKTPAIRSGDASLWKLVAFLFFNLFVLNTALTLVSHGRIPSSPKEFADVAFKQAALFFERRQFTDSLTPMIPALHLLKQNPRASLYRIIFFDGHNKFQYPMTSLLPYYALQRLGVSDDSLFLLSKRCINLSACLTILTTILMAFKLIPGRRDKGPRKLTMASVALAIGLSGLCFDPLMQAANVGQIQMILALGFSIALFCWISGKEAAAGAILGLMVLVKPQYGVFFVWALLRRKYNAAIAGLTCAGIGLTISCVLFGFHNNLDYIQVLQYIGHRGEAYLPNQSANGILNRFLFNGNILDFDNRNFAPLNPIVFWGTMASTSVLLALGLFFPWGKERRGSAADFACIVLTSTMASPIAWDHHYSILFPVFAWLWFGHYARKGSVWDKVAMGVAFVLCSDTIPQLSAFAVTPIWNVLASYLYFGAILALILLFRTSRETSLDRFAVLETVE